MNAIEEELKEIEKEIMEVRLRVAQLSYAIDGDSPLKVGCVVAGDFLKGAWYKVTQLLTRS